MRLTKIINGGIVLSSVGANWARFIRQQGIYVTASGAFENNQNEKSGVAPALSDMAHARLEKLINRL